MQIEPVGLFHGNKSIFNIDWNKSQKLPAKETMKRKRISDTDVSRAFGKTAGDYILIADNIDEARNRAAMAVIAWNISLYPQEQIAEQIRLVALE